MTVNRNALINELKFQHRDLTEQLHQCELALRAFGVDPNTMRVPPQRNSRQRAPSNRTTLDHEVQEQEVIRVLTELHPNPLTTAELYELGNFEGSSSSVYAAAMRSGNVDSFMEGRLRKFKLKHAPQAGQAIRRS